MDIIDIIIWLVIFIIGSLIVNFIIYPESLESFNNNIKNVISHQQTKSISQLDNFNYEDEENDIIKFIPKEMEEYKLWEDMYTCSWIESLGDSEGIINIKQKVCQETCGKRNKNYYSNECDKDILICYCIN